ncbi:rho guanine nucleotide exchange factor 10-like protein [Columba livia]|uniref:Rho guanine nucleotide exchange factor 10-like protein n=1 Tax=Columba livia TaxID=8932 RepID=A0A2I0M389_COLLI|nr:rho guanine nucleotide exchange factor 10-like protein [Columba livia]
MASSELPPHPALGDHLALATPSPHGEEDLGEAFTFEDSEEEEEEEDSSAEPRGDAILQAPPRRRRPASSSGDGLVLETQEGYVGFWGDFEGV